MLYFTLFLMKALIPFLLALKHNYKVKQSIDELVRGMRRGEAHYFVSHLKCLKNTAQIRNMFFTKVRKDRNV